MVLVMSAREDLLDALEGLLIDDGERAATLDAVAARAGVSKGGLLYHFPSKTALFDGLAGRLRDLAAADLELMASAPDGPSAYYVRSSVWEDTAFDRTLVAASRLSWTEDAPVRRAFADVRASWLALILEEVGDPAAAEAIMLIGDGLYYNAVLGGSSVPDGTAAGSRDLDGLLSVVARLREGRA
ncbi:TetR/AcrR family transcriptional regulator [Brachybacterium rhamnosum]|nr:TetR family transcriptional regulator [Brachybacterium sp. SGAir0954]